MTALVASLHRARARVVLIQGGLVGMGGALAFLAAFRAGNEARFGGECLGLAAGVWLVLTVAYGLEERWSSRQVAERADLWLDKRRAFVTAYEREAAQQRGPFDRVLNSDALEDVRFGSTLAALCPNSRLALLAPLIGGALFVGFTSGRSTPKAENLANLAGGAARELERALGEFGSSEGLDSTGSEAELTKVVAELERIERRLAAGRRDDDLGERLKNMEQQLSDLARQEGSPRSALRFDRAQGALEAMERALHEGGSVEQPGPAGQSPASTVPGIDPTTAAAPHGEAEAPFEASSQVPASGTAEGDSAQVGPNSRESNAEVDSPGASARPSIPGVRGPGPTVLPLELDAKQRVLVEAWVAAREMGRAPH